MKQHGINYGQQDNGSNPQNQSKQNSEVAARYKASPLTLTVFERETDNGTFHNCQMQRVYTKDDGDSWEYTESLRPQDLRKAARLMQKAADDFDNVRVETPDDE